jgi:hypothetical protein
MGRDAPHLSPDAVGALLKQLAPARAELVLIGGQALNLWAERYAGSCPELAAAAPFTSKDIDFCGTADNVRECAQLVGGTHQLFDVSDRTAAAGVVTTPTGIELDLVRTPCGVNPTEVVLHAVPLPSVRVMHPLHVLASRAANVVHIPRSDEHSLKQLQLAVFVVREFIHEVLRESSAREAHKLNEWAFEIAASEDSVKVWRAYAIDLFAAVLVVPELGNKFATRRYPQMAARIAELRNENSRAK